MSMRHRDGRYCSVRFLMCSALHPARRVVFSAVGVRRAAVPWPLCFVRRVGTLLRACTDCCFLLPPTSSTQAFQDISVHRFFNTNNLWVRLDLLKELMDSKGEC
jgi:hypothetical protein